MAVMGFQRWIRRYLNENHPLLPGGVAATVSLGLWLLGIWQPLERLAYDGLFKLRPDLEWDDRIAVIAIDEASLAEYGQWPWSRTRHVELLQALNNYQPAAVGFDVLFFDSSPIDSELAKAIEANRNVVLGSLGDDAELVPEFAEVVAGIGHILHEPDPDGISRQGIGFFQDEPPFSVAMLEAANLSEFQPLTSETGFGDQTPTYVWINWPSSLVSDPESGILDAVPTYSFMDVVASGNRPGDNIPEDAFKDKLVLVGFVATGFDDIVSPIGRIPGVYLHGALIDNLLNDRLIQPLPDWIAAILIIAIAVATAWLEFDRRLGGRLAIALVLPIGWFGIAFAAFTFANSWLPIAAPIGTMILTYTAVQLREQYEKQQLMNLFSQQVSPEMADMIWQRKAEIFLDGELPAQELTATVLFMDIRSFTTISEKMPPRELFIWLNQYLEEMSNCIMEHHGVIDKYIGDAIMAVFGTPFPHTNPEDIQQDALNACAACLAIHKKLTPLNKRLEAADQPLIRIGIGMHTGTLMAGSVGGKKRSNFSVIGDTVNVAARLEPMNKQFTENNPYNLLMTRDTYHLVRDRYLGQQVDEIQLRGKENPTKIYAILGERS
jgi:adenylate cyclase